MKLPVFKSFQTKTGANKTFNLNIRVEAANDQEAMQMQEALQSFVQHFSIAEMKSAAQKLKSPTNRKMIKTFL